MRLASSILLRTAATTTMLAAALSPALARTFERPVPNAQTSTAEAWFLAASVALLLALAAVQWLVARR